jgi:hypothetical protein
MFLLSGIEMLLGDAAIEPFLLHHADRPEIAG